MKAIQFCKTGGPEVLRLVDLPNPEPGPGEVLVQAAALGATSRALACESALSCDASGLIAAVF